VLVIFEDNGNIMDTDDWRILPIDSDGAILPGFTLFGQKVKILTFCIGLLRFISDTDYGIDSIV
jgi:hypothetical protein